MFSGGVVWVGLEVQNLSSEIEFYRDVIGLRFTRAGKDWAHFDLGNGTLFELFSGGTAATTQKNATQQSLVVGLPVDDLDQALAVLKARGVQFLGEIGQYKNQRWATFVDPEGNRIEIKEFSAPG